ncbi:MAG: aminotransferase class V-fold PLP-dependent enzyme [Pirellulales bacterium]|nr:aminotransferase class V-fold PLP-dependent enzyme [Pirellulales bacterium]
MNSTSLNRPNLPTFPELWGFDSSIAFLNHGSFGACPLPVLEYQRQLKAELERESMEFLLRKSQPLIDRSRQVLCELVGADPTDLVFVGNATAGVNAVLRSLKFQPGDEILATAHDYNACRNAANYVAERAGAKVVEVPLPLPIDSPEQVVDAVLARVAPRTKLVMLDHITSPTAIVFPVAEIVRRLAERNIDVLIDGAHAPGMVPLDLRRLGAAYYTGNCHKWLCAPKGAGFLYVRRDRQQKIVPPVIGHGYNKARPGYTRFQDLFDWPGTFDPTPWICVGRSIEFLSGLMDGGLSALMRRNNELAIWARRMLLERLCRTGFQPVNRGADCQSAQKSRQVENLSYEAKNPICPESMLGSMAAVILPFDIGNRLDETTSPTPTHWLFNELRKMHGIEAVFYHFPTPPQGILRISAQAYNAPEQYERLAEALKDYADLRAEYS